MTEYKNDKGSFLIVEVPKEASDICLPRIGMADLYWHSYVTDDEYVSAPIPSGNYELICGDVKLITEEQASELVDTTLMHKTHGVKSYKYKSYIDGFMGFETAKESAYTLFSSIGLVVFNPYGEKRPSLDDYDISNGSQDYMDGLQMEIGLNQNEWQEAEKQVKRFCLLKAI